MQKISGDLKKDAVIVKKPKEVGRLFNKSHFGKMKINGSLELNLLEGVFLKDEAKISIFKEGEELEFKELFKIAIEKISDFDKKYLIFKDLRSRGHAILFSDKKDYFFQDFKKNFIVTIFSERDCFDIDSIVELAKKVDKTDYELWFAIVDDEGDITYYNVSISNFKGKNIQATYLKTKGIVLNNRVIVFDENISKDLLDKEFYGKPFAKGLQLSIVEALYLFEKGVIEITDKEGKKLSKSQLIKLQPDLNLRSIVFKDLKKQGMIVKTGFKFGTHFRVYSSKPEETHAEYLVHVVEKGFLSNWAEISRGVRLAHSVNKEIVFSRVEKDKIEYVSFGRLRP